MYMYIINTVIKTMMHVLNPPGATILINPAPGDPILLPSGDLTDHFDVHVFTLLS